MTTVIDVDYLRSWIGREDVQESIASVDVAQRFHATLGLPGKPPVQGEVAPRMLHICLAQPMVPTAMLDADGHPQKGGFLPPVPLPRRMWAASKISFPGDIRIGDPVRRHSRISGVEVKHGRSGALCFVKVAHRVETAAGVAVEEEQVIVYREAQSIGSVVPPQTSSESTPQGADQNTVAIEAPLLFRYSAITFNAHRIHYDRPYATQVEGYSGLVIHGPLQATLLFYHAATVQGRPPAHFSFRGNAPAFDDAPLVLHAAPIVDGVQALWSAAPAGPIAMSAEARW